LLTKEWKKHTTHKKENACFYSKHLENSRMLCFYSNECLVLPGSRRVIIRDAIVLV
jgi:hypothetical protein